MNKGVHQIRIAGHNDHEIIALIFHSFQKGIDCFLPVIIATAAVEGVCFINKENTAHSLVDNLLCLNCRLTYISSNQTTAIRFNQLTLRQQAKALIQPCNIPGNSCFTGTRIAHKYKMQRHRRHAQTLRFSPLLMLYDMYQICDLILNHSQTDQGVQFSQYIFQGFSRRGGIRTPSNICFGNR